LEIKTSDVASIYIHGTQQLIAKTFEEAISKKPCAIFIDEIDAFVPNRGAGDVSHSYRSEVNEFLTHLNNCAENRILIMGATNMIKNIDPAVFASGSNG
jgi:transitional endoplasmic reticulum ATPase